MCSFSSPQIKTPFTVYFFNVWRAQLSRLGCLCCVRHKSGTVQLAFKAFGGREHSSEKGLRWEPRTVSTIFFFIIEVLQKRLPTVGLVPEDCFWFLVNLCERWTPNWSDVLFYTEASSSYSENFKERHLGDAHLAKQTSLISAVGLFLGSDLRVFYLWAVRTPLSGGVIIKHTSLNGHIICLENDIIIPACKTLSSSGIEDLDIIK